MHPSLRHNNLVIGSVVVALVSLCIFCWIMIVQTGNSALEHNNVFWIYISLLSLFHLLEFTCTAPFSKGEPSVDAFLLNHSWEYLTSILGSIIEYWIESYVNRVNIWINVYWNLLIAKRSIQLLGIIGMVFGQFLRSWAMVYAGSNFSHMIKRVRDCDHVLVTSGPYSWVRHPSYVGFIIWALSSQIMLLNPISLLVYYITLKRFFEDRIEMEEEYLAEFFGPSWYEYTQNVPSGTEFLI
jgi:protein-S-isoprenylcysteine O-methyltransferase